MFHKTTYFKYLKNCYCSSHCLICLLDRGCGGGSPAYSDGDPERFGLLCRHLLGGHRSILRDYKLVDFKGTGQRRQLARQHLDHLVNILLRVHVQLDGGLAIKGVLQVLPSGPHSLNVTLLIFY